MKSSDTPWISPLAKCGYAAKGVVYAIIGVLAAMAAFGGGGATTGSKGALAQIKELPAGNLLLIIIGIGLLAYCLYRLLAAFTDIEAAGAGGESMAKRVGYAGSGVTYGALAVAAFTGLASSSGGKQDLTAKILSMPGGAWIIGLLGVALGITGIQQWRKISKGSYRYKFDLDGAAAGQRQWIERIAKLGLAARGVVFLIIGFFLIQAAVQSDSSEVRGLGGALQTLAEQPYGPWLLGLVAIGLVCYGIYCWVIAIYGSFRKSV